MCNFFKVTLVETCVNMAQQERYQELLTLTSPPPPIQSPRPLRSPNANNNNNNNNLEVKHSPNTGLLFPSGRVWNNINDKIVNDTRNDYKSLTPDAAVYLSAVLEHITSELLVLAGNAAKRADKKRIEPPDIENAVRIDQEFGIFFETKESKSRLSVPASPFDINENKENSAKRSYSNLRFWAEAENERESENDRESETECTELGTEHKDTDDELDEIFIPGLYYIDNYITNEQHDSILQFFNNNEWDKIDTRIVQQYIYKLLPQKGDKLKQDLKRIKKKPFDEMPFCVEGILNQIINDKRFGIDDDYYFDQLSVNNYPSFGGISYHFDSIDCFDDFIVCLSFLSEAVINFKNIETNEIKQLLLKPKSLLILSGDARYKWKHGITDNNVHFYDGMRINRQQRISLTFRKCINLDLSQSNVEYDEDKEDEDKEDEDKEPHSATTITKQKTDNDKNEFLFKIDSILSKIDDFMD